MKAQKNRGEAATKYCSEVTITLTIAPVVQKQSSTLYYIITCSASTMDQLPNLLSNREAYRRSLQSSLHDVLGDLSSDAQQMGHIASLRREQQQQQQHEQLLQQTAKPTAAAAGGLNPQASSFNMSMLLRNPQTSLLTQSLGGASPAYFAQAASLMGLNLPTDNGSNNLLLAKFAAENQMIARAANAALLQSLATQRRNKVLEELLRGKSAPGAAAAHQHTNSNASAAMHPSLLHAASLASAPQVPTKEEAAREKKQKIAQTLKALGANLRSRYDPFIDCIDIEDPEEEAAQRSRGGTSVPSPSDFAYLTLLRIVGSHPFLSST